MRDGRLHSFTCDRKILSYFRFDINIALQYQATKKKQFLNSVFKDHFYPK